MLMILANIVAYVICYLLQFEDVLVEPDLLPNVGDQLLLLGVPVVEKALVVLDFIVDVCSFGIK